jgi:hypothetical protein
LWVAYGQPTISTLYLMQWHKSFQHPFAESHPANLLAKATNSSGKQHTRRQTQIGALYDLTDSFRYVPFNLD